MSDIELVKFFENLTKRFYNEDESFKKFIDDGAQEILGWNAMCVDNYMCHIECGSQRACLIFDGKGNDYNDIVDKYVVKLSLDFLLYGECAQMAREFDNYNSFKAINYQDLVTRIVKGNEITKVFNLDRSSDARLYIVERADVSEEEYDEVLYGFVEKNLDIFDEPNWWYWDEHKGQTFDELDRDEKDDYITMILEEYDNFDKFEWLLGECGYRVSYDATFWDLICSIGDLHSGNISISNRKIKLIDFGWDADKGSDW